MGPECFCSVLSLGKWRFLMSPKSKVLLSIRASASNDLANGWMSKLDGPFESESACFEGSLDSEAVAEGFSMGCLFSNTLSRNS